MEEQPQRALLPLMDSPGNPDLRAFLGLLAEAKAIKKKENRVMSNVYHAGTVEGKLTILDEGVIILHGGISTMKAKELDESGMSPHDIAKHFCGYCGGYTENPGTCPCGSYREQYL